MTAGNWYSKATNHQGYYLLRRSESPYHCLSSIGIQYFQSLSRRVVIAITESPDWDPDSALSPAKKAGEGLKSVGQKTLTSGLIAPVLWQAFPTSVNFSALVDSNFVSNFLPHSGRPVFMILGNFSHLPLPIPWIFPIGSHHCWSSIEKPLFPEVNPCISWTAVRLNIETSPSSSVSSLSATWINSKAPDYQTHHAQSDLYIV